MKLIQQLNEAVNNAKVTLAFQSDLIRTQEDVPALEKFLSDASERHSLMNAFKRSRESESITSIKIENGKICVYIDPKKVSKEYSELVVRIYENWVSDITHFFNLKFQTETDALLSKAISDKVLTLSVSKFSAQTLKRFSQIVSDGASILRDNLVVSVTKSGRVAKVEFKKSLTAEAYYKTYADLEKWLESNCEDHETAAARYAFLSIRSLIVDTLHKLGSRKSEDSLIKAVNMALVKDSTDFEDADVKDGQSMIGFLRDEGFTHEQISHAMNYIQSGN